MSIIEEIGKLSEAAGTNLPKLADLIWNLKQSAPEAFAKLPKWTKLGRRRAAALAAIGRVFGEGKLAPEVMIAIGWTKLDAIAPYVTEKTKAMLLHQAQHLSVTNLRRFLRGDPIVPDARVMLLEFSPEDYEIIAETLLAYGAIGDSEGMSGKETALVAAFQHLRALITQSGIKNKQ